MLASTLGISRPSSNTNTDRPTRSPAGSGATSRGRAWRCDAVAAAGEGRRDGLLLAGSGRARRHDRDRAGRAATRPPAADCERTLSVTAGPEGSATTLKPPGSACASPADSSAGEPGRRRHREPHAVRRGGVIGEAEREREDEATRAAATEIANSRAATAGEAAAVCQAWGSSQVHVGHSVTNDQAVTSDTTTCETVMTTCILSLMESPPDGPRPGAGATRRRRARRSSRRRARSSTSAATRARPSGRSRTGPASRTAWSCGTSAARSSCSSRRCPGRAPPPRSRPVTWTRSRSASRRRSWRQTEPAGGGQTPFVVALIRSAASGDEVRDAALRGGRARGHRDLP